MRAMRVNSCMYSAVVIEAKASLWWGRFFARCFFTSVEQSIRPLHDVNGACLWSLFFQLLSLRPHTSRSPSELQSVLLAFALCDEALALAVCLPNCQRLVFFFYIPGLALPNDHWLRVVLAKTVTNVHLAATMTHLITSHRLPTPVPSFKTNIPKSCIRMGSIGILKRQKLFVVDEE